MKYIRQILIILLFTFLGQVLEAVIPFPVPAAIYGIVLLLIALCTGIVKPAAIQETSDFLIKIMPLLFVPPSVRILEFWGIIGSNVAAVIVIASGTTFLVFAVSGLVTQLLLKKKEGKDRG
jgi:holin-like protein